MSKISYLFVVGLLIFSFMTVQSLIPVFANSSTATIIGGATNGNIFGSIQFDEMNVTDTGVWRFDTGGGPILATATYGAVNPTLVYNSSVIITLPLTLFAATADFQGNAANNLGAAGNDFGASNTLVGTTFSGTVDGGSQLFNNLGAAGNDFGAADNGLIRTTFSGDIRINSGISIASGGGGNPDIVTFTYPATTSWNGTWTHNFNSASVTNVGAAGNDFGATNNLVSTDFSGSIQISDLDIEQVRRIEGPTDGTNMLLRTHPSLGVAANVFEIQTQNTALDGWVARWTIPDGADVIDMKFTSSNLILDTNNTRTLFADGNRPADIQTVIITSKSQVTGDINFEGGGLDWTLIETGILGDKYKGLVLIDKPTIVNGKWVYPENYRRIFEVNERGVFHLGNQLAFNNQISDLQSQINSLKQELEILKGN